MFHYLHYLYTFQKYTKTNWHAFQVQTEEKLSFSKPLYWQRVSNPFEKFCFLKYRLLLISLYLWHEEKESCGFSRNATIILYSHRFIFVRNQPKIIKYGLPINEWITNFMSTNSSIPLTLWRSNSYTCKCIFSQRGIRDMVRDCRILANVFQSIYFPYDK